MSVEPSSFPCRVFALGLMTPFLMGNGALAASSADTITLENDALRVEVSARTGAITGGGWREGPSDLLAASDGVRLRAPRGNVEGRWLTADRRRGLSPSLRSGTAVTLTGTLATGDGVADHASVRLQYRLEDQDLVLSLEVWNQAGVAIDQIEFPSLRLPAGDGSETFERAEGSLRLRDVFSSNRIRFRHDPFERLDPNDYRGWAYDDPGIQWKVFQYPTGFSLSTAWIHYTAGRFGVALESRDRSFQIQYAFVTQALQRDARSAARNAWTYGLGWRFIPQVAPGANWRSPEMRIHFDRGDWHGIARRHREWMQSWQRRPVVPAAFRQSLGWMSRGINSYDQIPVYAAQAVASGTPYLLIYGWFGSIANGGMNGLSYEYHPQQILGGEDSLRRNLQKAKDAGAYPLAWYNGTTSSEIKAEHRERGRDWILWNRHGGASIDGRWSLYDPDRPPTSDDASTIFNTDMGAGAATFNVENVTRLIRQYGFAGLEMDQVGKNFPAYSPTRSWSDPQLRYGKGVIGLLEQVRAIVKQATPDGIMITEGSSDLQGQYIDSGWTFEGGHVVPARDGYFRYSLPWITRPAAIRTPDPGYVNQAFVMNAPLDLFLDPSQHPAFLAHLRKLLALKREVAPYLHDGDFNDEEGFTLLQGEGSALLARSYLQPDGRLAVVIANLTDTPRTARLTIADSRAADWRIFGAPSGPGPARQSGAAADTLQLDAFDVRVILSGHEAALGGVEPR
ncbi:MAG: hypothetical protein U1F35_06160 [Steroidobacteraceae bacterium]